MELAEGEVYESEKCYTLGQHYTCEEIACRCWCHLRGDKRKARDLLQDYVVQPRHDYYDGDAGSLSL